VEEPFAQEQRKKRLLQVDTVGHFPKDQYLAQTALLVTGQ
jgi:hypothetical protein